MQHKGDPFWISDFSILYRDGRLYDIVPNKKHKSIHEEYNAFTRLVLLYGAIVSLFKQESSYFVWALVMVILVSVFVNHKSKVLAKPHNRGQVSINSNRNPCADNEPWKIRTATSCIKTHTIILTCVR